MGQLDHRGLIASLDRGMRVALLCRSDAAGFVQLVPHAAAVLATGTAIAAGVPFWPLLLVPQGIVIVFLFTALNECSCAPT
jgi:fatty acid desaturase